MPSPQAPALHRGILVLRLLGDVGALSLEEIARRTDLPKSSLTRLLDTLIALEVVARNPRTKAFRALARLVPLEERGRVFAEALAQALDHLAQATGQTAEWYVPGKDGMVMVQRAEPAAMEVGVRARIGFVRPWRGELDAVAALGHAHFQPHSGKGPFWCYDARGKRTKLAAERVQRIVREARQQRTSADQLCNPNGVRRLSALVERGGAPVGILALAQVVRPVGKDRQDEYQRILREQAQALNRRGALSSTQPEQRR